MKDARRVDRVDFYRRWIGEEGIPIIRDWYVEDIRKIPLEPWQRTGGLGAYLDLIGSADRTGAYICEIPPGASLKPEKHLFEELICIVSGKGTASVWNEGGPKRTFEWQEGSLFSPPLNSWHQLSNIQTDKPARFFAVTGAPVFMNLFHNADFIFNNNFVFKDRYAGENDYFSEKGELVEISSRPVWEGNFIKDVRSFKIPSFEQMGKEMMWSNFELSENTMEAHISGFTPGTYKKAHRHSGGAFILILEGEGYSLTWPDLGAKRRFDWHDGSVIVPPEGWWHTHFILGNKPAFQLALRWDGTKYRFGKQWEYTLDVKKGGDQTEYADEDPEIRRMFEEELTKRGLKLRMDNSLYKRRDD